MKELFEADSKIGFGVSPLSRLRRKSLRSLRPAVSALRWRLQKRFAIHTKVG